jgi:hypothetical protein
VIVKTAVAAPHAVAPAVADALKTMLPEALPDARPAMLAVALIENDAFATKETLPFQAV